MGWILSTNKYQVQIKLLLMIHAASKMFSYWLASTSVCKMSSLSWLLFIKNMTKWLVSLSLVESRRAVWSKHSIPIEVSWLVLQKSLWAPQLEDLGMFISWNSRFFGLKKSLLTKNWIVNSSLQVNLCCENVCCRMFHWSCRRTQPQFISLHALLKTDKYMIHV